MMISEINQLEAIARQLEPNKNQREQLIQRVSAYSQAYLEGISDAPANYAFEDGRGLYESPIAEEGIEIGEALDLLGENVDKSGIGTTSGRFLGYIPGGALFPSALGDYLAAVSNRYAGFFFASPGAVRLENMLISWMAGVIGYSSKAAGNLTSGGSLANLLAIITARDTHSITGDKLARSVIYFTEHIHHSIDKAIHVAGLSGCVKHKVPVDKRYRMDAEALRSAIATDRAAGLNPWLVVGSAGTTNTGSVDPLAEIAGIAADHGLWFHADGAYGGFFKLCPEGRAALNGLELADSLVMDPHKTLFLPYGTGALLVKDGAKLYASQNWDAAYMQDAPENMEELSPAELSPELTKHFRGLRLWLPLKLFGLAPFRAALSETIQLARYFHQKIQSIDGFEVGPTPDLSVVTYRYLPPRGDVDAFNEMLTKKIQQDGRIFISSTRIDGKFILRVAISSFRTHLSDIDEALNVLKWTAKELAEEGY
jgi:glutamate/tyrosine decarboxylase-like PLP-dependent enzyme